MRERSNTDDGHERNDMRLLGSFLQARKLADYKALNRHVQPGGIVFAGDSITEGFPIHELLQSGRRLYNRGIGGYTSSMLLENLPDLAVELKPEQVFLQIGTNDLGEGKQADEVAAQVREICAALRGQLPHAQLVLLSLYPVNAAAEPELPFPVVGCRTNAAIGAVNRLLEQVATELGLDYGDIHSILKDGAGNLQSSYTYDGLHLNAQGYEAVKAFIQSRLLS